MGGAARVLNVAGLWNSGPQHWQSHWEAAHADIRRVAQSDWDRPACEDWIAALDAAVLAAGPAVVLTAHSLGCATVAHWARRYGRAIRGALLVAPSDVEAPSYPDCTTGFKPMPLARLPFPSILVSSSDDDYVAPARARSFAQAWGSRLVELGPLGHINSASGLGSWTEGYALLEELVRG